MREAWGEHGREKAGEITAPSAGNVAKAKFVRVNQPSYCQSPAQALLALFTFRLIIQLSNGLVVAAPSRLRRMLKSSLIASRNN